MGIIAWIVLGAIAGFITNMIMGGSEGVIGSPWESWRLPA